MTDTPASRVLVWESRLIIQLYRLAGVQHKLTKQLVNGRSISEITGAHMDLRNIAAQIEALTKDAP